MTQRMTQRLPDSHVPVLALISTQRDLRNVVSLGLSRWHEVVYYNDLVKEWKSYTSSMTFDTYDYVVESWVYCDDVLPSAPPITQDNKQQLPTN